MLHRSLFFRTAIFLSLARCSPAGEGESANTGGSSANLGGTSSGASPGGANGGGGITGTGGSGEGAGSGGLSLAGGAAGVAGNAGAGAAAGSSGAGDAGGEEPACEIVCDDFEGPTVDGARWRVIGAAPELSQDRAHSGTQSLLFAELGQTGRFLTSVAPFPSGGRLFFRAYMNFDLATVDMAGHTGFIVGAVGDTNTAELRWGQSQPGCVAQDQLLDLNHIPSDKTMCSSGLVSGGNPNDFANPGVTLEADRWYCVELFFDTVVGEFRLWIDEDEIEVLHATADSWCPPGQQCAPPDPWPIPMTLVKFGTQVYNGTAGNIWYDDLELGTAPIGCD